MSIEIIQNTEKAISVMHKVGQWMKDSGMNPSKWWKPENLNKKFLFKYANPSEFYVTLVNGKPAAAAILQINQNTQDWKVIDKNKKAPALYIHWLCVAREFAQKGLPRKMIDFAIMLAKNKGVKFLRADTNASEEKLKTLYENLGFRLISQVNEGYRTTAFYQMALE